MRFYQSYYGYYYQYLLVILWNLFFSKANGNTLVLKETLIVNSFNFKVKIYNFYYIIYNAI